MKLLDIKEQGGNTVTICESLAVKAPDGTIRTAFNTCQVCYSSGRVNLYTGGRCISMLL